MDVISFTREGGLAVVKPLGFLDGERFNDYRKATEGSTYDFKRKVGLVTIDKLPGILKRLREADFETRLTEDLTLALSEHTTQLWLDVQGAKDRVELIDAEIRERNKTPQGLYPFQKTGAAWLAMKHGGVLADEQGTGKLQAVSEPVLTPHGWVPIGSLRVGDEVIGSNGQPTKVLKVFPQGVQKQYRVVFNDGTWTRAGAEHLWTVRNNNDRRTGRWRVMTTASLQEQIHIRWWIPLVEPVSFDSQKQLPLHPYLLGALIANGCCGRHVAHSGSNEQRRLMEPYLPEGVSFNDIDGVTSRLVVNKTRETNKTNPVMQGLRDLGLQGKRSWEKHIPNEYLFASVEDRIALLQGLMDNDGTVSRLKRDASNAGAIEYNTTSPRLAEGILHLIRSLGAVAWETTRHPSYLYKGERREGRIDHRIRMMLPPGFQPFRLDEKVRHVVQRTKYLPAHAIDKIEPDGEEESVCIKVEAEDALYVTRDFILTHNTLQTIAALPARTATLIVCPAVAKGVWRREIKRWRPAIRTTVLHGRGSFRWPEVGEAVILNYELLPEAHTTECLEKRKSKSKVLGEHKADCLKAQRNVFIPAVAEMAKRCKGCLLESDLAKRCKGCAPFLETVPDNLTMVVDEGHALKNPNSQRTVRFRGISRKCRARHGRVWVLTGTPLLNKPPELWSVLDAAEVAESAFGSFKAMVEMFGGKSKKFGGFDWGQPDEARIAVGMQSVMLRRLREEVMPELPRKTVQLWPVEISATLSKACDAAVAKYGGMDAIQADLKKGVSFGTLARVRAALATAKMDAMLELVEEYEEQEEPVVVFSAHRAPIDVLAHRPGWRVITGDTTPEERTEIEDLFQAGNLRGVGSTIRAGGVAITLTRACFAIFVDLEWTPGLNEQAEDRICRISQKRPVLIRVLVAEHKLDERIAELLEEKTDIINASVNAARERVG